MIPGLVQWVKGFGLAIAVIEVAAEAQIQSLAQELTYAMCSATKKKSILKCCIDKHFYY